MTPNKFGQEIFCVNETEAINLSSLLDVRAFFEIAIQPAITQVRKAPQTTNGYISARIRLTFLSPSLIKKILNGEVPNTISPTRLIDASKDLPIKWAEQDRFIEALAR
jgi:hypothetical protein